MTAIAQLVAGATPIERGFQVDTGTGWMQGRTLYGGLTAALALQAALDLEPDLPPLRSAQIAFIGPLSGEVTVTATRLRRGRNAAFLQSDVISEAGLGLRATFVFMAALPSAIAHDAAPRAPLPPPGLDARPRSGPENFFAHNFEFLDMREAAGPAEWLRWARLRERAGLHPMVELLAIGDGLPPAAYKLSTDRNVPLSSLNWTINFLTAEPATDNGWWLLASTADMARAGYSSQRMMLWNARGDAIAEAMQGVAIFG